MANQLFDEAVKQFLLNWMEHATISGLANSFTIDTTPHSFVEEGALRTFFRLHVEDALELLMTDRVIARHLLRPISEVYFENDAYEPMLARFERRIYNLAMHREHLEVPFRYSSPSRQGDYGDTLIPAVTSDEPIREDIGMYFGTRRSDETALSILGGQLRREVAVSAPSALPIHIITEGYMTESLQAVREHAAMLGSIGETQPQCFIIQRRHAADDRHLGAALLLMDPQHPGRPQRIIFGDTLNPGGQPPWWDKFRAKIDSVFAQPEGVAPVSDILEDGGVKLQRLHDGVPVRHQDIDCAFYTASMCRSLIQLIHESPELVLTGDIKSIVSRMTAGMPEYYEEADQPRSPELVREENVVRRWNTGQEALRKIWQRQTNAPKAALPLKAVAAS
ncbi:hypothetical protein [Spirosoma sp. KUDC1026]|uniref:hypothetical protein n=1 Tax=Spirosoma sp. KUDC1026 TaxID=2745947 RepID=UPI001E37CCAF|nr:hypothetical protein [Spirosoma sp. KUDC1026]